MLSAFHDLLGHWNGWPSAKVPDNSEKVILGYEFWWIV